MEKENESSVVDIQSEMEKRKRRRQSKTFQARRKSLTPSTKKKQYLTDMYSTIIQMSSENKINQKNSWSLHLIDHMDDVLDTRQENNNQVQPLFNFQKASCTLDASIKIYSNRVDDTWNSSYKILENLTRSDESKTQASVEQMEKKTTSKRIGAIATLESNIKNINVKTLEVEGQVDPLFHKMSQNFDEGGAKGLLLVNLTVDDECQIIFDSTDKQVTTSVNSITSEEEIEMDLSMLKSQLSQYRSCLSSSRICPRVNMLYEEMGQESNSNKKEGDDDCLDDNDVISSPMDWDNEDAASLAEDYADEEHEVALQAQFESNDDDDVASVATTDMTDLTNRFETLDVVLEASFQTSSCSSEYAYFEPSVLKTHQWAGPMHWKGCTRPVSRTINPKKGKTTTAVRKKSSKKTAVDFSDPLPSIKLLPPAVTTFSTIVLEKNMQNSELYQLPIDHQCSLQQLSTLFLHPTRTFARREVHRQVQHDIESNHHDEEGHRGYNDDDVDSMHDDNEPMDHHHYMENENTPHKNNENDFEYVQPDRTLIVPTIKHAIKASSVDVKALKSKVWKTVQKQPTTPFSHIVDSLQETMTHPISVSFYFLSILHVANEQGLELQGHADLKDFTIQNGVQQYSVI